jgi:hypothetical protein
MKSTLIGLGVGLTLVGAFFTIITFGFGFICSWPLIVVGIILFLMGLVFPEERGPAGVPSSQQRRFCTNCGREIPLDANICPYCGKNFQM